MYDNDGYRSVKGEMVFGYTKDGQLYSTPFKEADHNYAGLPPKDKTDERYVVKFQEREDGVLVVDSLRRDDLRTDQVQESFEKGEVSDHQVESLTKPKTVEFAGMGFQEGLQPKVVDPEMAMSDESMKAFDSMRASYNRSQEGFGEQKPVSLDLNDMVKEQARAQRDVQVRGLEGDDAPEVSQGLER